MGQKKKREGNSPAQPKQLEKRSWLAEKREKDPIGIELGKLAAAASASGAKLEEATSRAEGYSRRNKEVDGAAEILLGCLKEFPAGGRENLVRDILSRDDAGLKNLADGIRRWVFYPSKYLLRTRSSCSD